jgi:hypothetical protein
MADCRNFRDSSYEFRRRAYARLWTQEVFDIVETRVTVDVIDHRHIICHVYGIEIALGSQVTGRGAQSYEDVPFGFRISYHILILTEPNEGKNY